MTDIDPITEYHFRMAIPARGGAVAGPSHVELMADSALVQGYLQTNTSPKQTVPGVGSGLGVAVTVR